MADQARKDAQMPRINTVNLASADPKARALLECVRQSLGMTPNLIGALANSPAALGAYLGFGQSLAAGVLGAQLREQVAVAVAGANGCEYCASAHSALAKAQKVDDAELALNLEGDSSNDRTRAALQFVTAIVNKRGWLSDDDLSAVRAAGFTDGELVELIAVVAINTFTNYFNHIAQTVIDFPRIAVTAPIAS
jgi:uncharacterized peroxidase-related enzyme